MGVRRIGLWMGRALLVLSVIWGVTLAAVVVATGGGDRPDMPAPGSADAIICLGAGMSRTQGWTIPDAATERRAATCAQLYNAGVAPVVLFTGYGHDLYSAAAAMADVARDHGVPSGAVLLEEYAASTIQNAAFAFPLLPEGTERILVVSDAFHLPRSRVIFQFLGEYEVATFPADPALARDIDHNTRGPFRWLAREATAIWFNLARLAAYGLGGLAGIDHDTRISWFN